MTSTEQSHNGAPQRQSADNFALAVIIVSYRCAPYLQATIATVIDQLKPSDQLIVWDNNSNDSATLALLEQLESERPDIVIERSTTNLGFAEGNNRAAACAAEDQHLLLLNPDARLCDGALEALRQALKSNPGAGAIGTIQLDESGDLIDGIGDVLHLSGLSWRSGYGRDARELERLIGTVDERSPVSPIFCPCAAAALYRREAFNAVGGFDTTFFCYGEDVDLGFRLRLAGWQCLRANRAQVLHAGSVSTGVGSDFSIYHGHRNLVWSFFKNMPATLMPVALPVHILMTLYIIARYAAKGKLRVILRAKADAFLGLPRALTKRRRVRRSTTLNATEVWALLNKSWRRQL